MIRKLLGVLALSSVFAGVYTVSAQDDEVSPTEQCNIVDKLTEVTEKLDKTQLRVWEDSESNPTREIALGILNDTCQTSIIKIIRKNNKFSIPKEFKEYQVEIIPRLNRFWNGTATYFRIVSPSRTMVLKLRFPSISTQIRPKTVVIKKRRQVVFRRQRVIQDVIGVAYNEDLRTPQILGLGFQHLDEIVEQAYQALREAKVQSLLVSDTLLVDNPYLKPEYLIALPLLEQSDPGECLDESIHQNCDKTYEMILVRLGIDQDKAYTSTTSRAKARGPVQFTKGTYLLMQKWFPKASLIVDFNQGAADHVNSMKAALLLLEYTLMRLVEQFGERVLEDSQLPEYLLASYNGGDGRVASSIKIKYKSGLVDWLESGYARNRKAKPRTILKETYDYIRKYRKLLAYGLAQKVVPHSDIRP